MFDALTDKLQGVFSGLKGRGKLTESASCHFSPAHHPTSNACRHSPTTNLLAIGAGCVGSEEGVTLVRRV